MSELTSYNSERIYWAVEQVEQESGDIDNLHLDDNLFCLKSEADKVIADKDKEIAELKGDYKEACDRLQTANLIKDEQLAATRHQKYKRCRAMARWCENKLGTVVKPGWWDKWRMHWLELAEKLKEAE